MTAVAERPRAKGRGRATRAQRASHAACELAFRGGWGARLARRFGLQRGPAVDAREFRLASRAAGAPPLRVAFASDFHAGAVTHPALLAEACRLLSDARPDVVLLGGDFVAFNACDVEPLVGLLGDVAAPLGKFAVLGNHDLLDDDAHVARRLEDAGVRVLVNDSARLAPPHDDVWVCGLDDPIHGEPNAARATEGADGARVVLMHAPDGLLALGDRRWDVALCGHTHGGQVALPWGYAPVVPAGRLSRRFVRGLFALGGGRSLLVSRGVGCSSMPVRLFARPQVHVCEIVGAADS